MINYFIAWALVGTIIVGLLDWNDVRKGSDLTLSGLIIGLLIGFVTGPFLLIVLFFELKDTVVIKGRRG